MAVERYVQREAARVNWNIREMSKEERAVLKENLVIGLIDNEEDYQAVIGYMYKKYPQEMDGLKGPDGKSNVAIQWNYKVAKNKLMTHNSITGKDQDMYALVVFDKARDMEPVIFAGSYFKLANALARDFDTLEELKADKELNKKYLCNSKGENDKTGKYQRVGYGYVMFCDPNYRRLGLATDLWWAEAQLYREALNIRVQREIQNEYSLVSTQKMFSDPSKCIITSEGRLKQDGTRSQIRVLLDYEDSDLVEGFNNMLPGLKTIYNPADLSFIEKEGFTKEELIKYWCK